MLSEFEKRCCLLPCLIGRLWNPLSNPHLNIYSTASLFSWSRYPSFSVSFSIIDKCFESVYLTVSKIKNLYFLKYGTFTHLLEYEIQTRIICWANICELSKMPSSFEEFMLFFFLCPLSLQRCMACVLW